MASEDFILNFVGNVSGLVGNLTTAANSWDKMRHATERAAKSQEQASAVATNKIAELQAQLAGVEARMRGHSIAQQEASKRTQEYANHVAALTAGLVSARQAQERYGEAAATAAAKEEAGKRLNKSDVGALSQWRNQIEIVKLMEQELGTYGQRAASAAAEEEKLAAKVETKAAKMKQLQAQIEKIQQFGVGARATGGKPSDAEEKKLSTWEKIGKAISEAQVMVDKYAKTAEHAANAANQSFRVINSLTRTLFGKEVFKTSHDSMKQATRSVDAYSKSLFGVGSVMAQIAPQQTQFVASMGLMGKEAQQSAGGLTFLAASAASFVGNLATQAVVGFGQAVMSAGQSALQHVANFERLSLSMTAMQARLMMNNDATLKFGDAMDLAAPKAQEVLQWVEKLALLSPFSVEDIRQSFSFAMSMNFQTDQAQRLTTALTNWAAATGKGGNEIFRAIYAMSQMNTAGRLMGQDLMQLSQVGISADAILSRAMGHTTAEIRAMREKGLIPVQDALGFIIADLEKFGDAAQRQAGSVSGLLASLGDLGPMILRNVFGPMVQTRTVLNTMNDEMKDVNKTTTEVGGVIGAFQKRLQVLVSTLMSEDFMNMARNFGLQFGKVAEDAFQWGENIINQFANGMISAIGAIIDALSNIGSIIGYWLSPGSPPRILPELDKWGSGAMLAYMEGWKNIDFSSFNDIASSITSFIQSIPESIIPKVDFVPMVMGMREKLAEALNQMKGGMSSADAAAMILGPLGSNSAPLTDYVKSMLDLSFANESVAAAQEEVNKLTKEYNDLIKPIDEELAKLDEASQKLAEDQQLFALEMAMNDPNATAAEKEKARLEKEKIIAGQRRRLLATEAKEKMDAAQEALDAEVAKQELAQKAYEQQKALIDVQAENNRLVSQQLALLEQMAKAGGGGGGGAGGAGKPKPPAGPGFAGISPELPGSEIPEQIKERLAEIQAIFEEKGAKLKAVWQEVWDKITQKLAPVFAAFEKVKTSVGGLFSTIAASAPKAQEVIGKILAAIVNQTAITGPSILENVAAAIDAIGKLWAVHGESFMSLGGFIAELGIATVASTITALTGLVTAILQLLSGDTKAAAETLKETLGKVVESALMVANVKPEDFTSTWTTNLEMLGTIISVGLTNIKESVFVKLLEEWKNAVVGFWTQVHTTVTGALTPLGVVISGFLALFKGWWESNSTTIKTVWNTVWTTVQTVFQNWLTWITEVFGAFSAAFKGDWKAAWEHVKNAFRTSWDTVKTVLTNAWKNITLQVETGIQNVKDFFTETDWAALGTAIVDGIVKGLQDAANFLYTAVSNLVDGIFNTAQDEAEARSPSKRAERDIGKTIPQGIAMGVTKNMGAVHQATRALVNSVIMPPAMASAQAAQYSYSESYAPSYTYSPTYGATPPNPARSFALMEAMAK